MFRALFALALLLTASPSLAQTVPNSPEGLASAFFSTLQGGNSLKAYNDIWRDTMMSKKQADVEALAGQTDNALKIYGKALGWELVSEEKISASFYQHTYLVRTENVPLFFRIQFYKAQSRWVATNITFTDTYKNLP